MQYILLEAPDPDKLTKQVRRLLDQGWELYGHPFFAAWTARIPAYAQALTNEHDLPQAASTEIPERLNSREVLSLLQDALSNPVALNPEQQQKHDRAHQLLSKLAERAKSRDAEADTD